MTTFRFAILGAGNIAGKFCDAVNLVENCQVTAVASKSIKRAKDFAEKNQVACAYGSYEEMLEKERPDCAYIAVTPNDHYRLSMLCLERGVPVLCEKAMFQNSAEAREVFSFARERGLFVMEALWSRFLPSIRQAKSWLSDGQIGMPELVQCIIGFRAEENPDNRYYSPKLGGGAAKDITVYAYEITTFLIEQQIKHMTAAALWSDTGVDLSDHVTLEFEHTLADLMTTFSANTDERLVIYGKEGKILIPTPHYSSECFLYDEKGILKEHFVDDVTKNGFTYEIEEVIRCVREGCLESPVVPHCVTLACAKLFDQIEKTRNQAI